MNSDPNEAMLERIGVEWLSQYARFLRRTPDLAARLAGDTGEFELVPVPRTLLDHLAVPGIADSGHLGGGLAREMEEFLRIGQNDQYRGVVGPGEAPATAARSALLPAQAFAGAVQTGDLQAVSQLISRRFLDEDARGSDEILAVLTQLISETSDRSMRVLHMEEHCNSDAGAMVRFQVAWDALTEGGSSSSIVETLTLEMLLDRHEGGQWKIVSIRST